MIKKLWKLFFSMVYLSTFTFGGGYVIVTLMQKKFVDEYHWINRDEMLDLVAIAQSAPGAIAVVGSHNSFGVPGESAACTKCPYKKKLKALEKLISK